MNVALETAVTAAHKPGFINVLRSELYKTLRLRVTLVGAILAFVPTTIMLGYLLTTNFIQANLAHNPGNQGAWLDSTFQEGLDITRVFSGIFLIVLTVQIFGQEYQHGTLRIILARGVDRLHLTIAKLLAACAIALGALTVYLTITFALIALAIIRATSGTQIFQKLPTTFGHDMLLFVVSILFSAAATILMAMAFTIMGRSLAFGMGLSLIFFPADNIAVGICNAIAVGTNNLFWAKLPAYLLGPTLNAMPISLITGGNHIAAPVQPIGNIPAVVYDGTHAIVVTLIYMAAFATISLVLMRQRDIHE